MIGKNEEFEDNNTSGKRANLLSERKKSLEDSSAKVKEEVRLCFEQLAKVLTTRENQLIRQIEAVRNQQLTIVQSNREISHSVSPLRINFSEKHHLEEAILKFGELSSSNRNGIDVRDAEPYKIEDYEEADRDHVTLEKNIETVLDNEEIIGEKDKFDDSTDGPCDFSINASSDADFTSENEITVLMNHNYRHSIEGTREHFSSPKLSRTTEGKFDSSNEDEMKDDVSANNSTELQINFTIGTNEDYCVAPESADNSIDDNIDVSNDEELTSDGNGDGLTTRKKKVTQDGEKHPKQIQQWLQQILVETETEPTIHEIEQFAEISKSRFREFQFSLET